MKRSAPPPIDPSRFSSSGEHEFRRVQIIIGIVVLALILIAILCWLLSPKPSQSSSSGPSHNSRAADGHVHEQVAKLMQDRLSKIETKGKAEDSPDSQDPNQKETKDKASLKSSTTSPTVRDKATTKKLETSRMHNASGSKKVNGGMLRNANQIGVSGIISNSVEFFGIEADAGTVMYVIDKSSSMGSLKRLEQAKAELISSLQSLNDSQSFGIVWFSSTAVAQIQTPIPSTSKNKAKAIQRIKSVYAAGGTNPTPAIKIALETQADAIFLLSDGEVDQYCVGEIARLNSRKIPIHTISFSSQVVHLKKIAEDSGGFFNVAK